MPPKPKPLDHKKVAALKVKATEDGDARKYKADTEEPALGIRYGTSGKKVFTVRARLGGKGNPRRWTLGQFADDTSQFRGQDFSPLAKTPFLSLAQARIKAKVYLDLIRQGVDPDERAKEAKAEAKEKALADKERALEEERAREAERIRQIENSFGNVVEKFLEAKHPDGSDDHPLRPNTYYDYSRILRGQDFAAWRAKPIDNISRAEVKRVMEAIKARAPASARLSFMVLRSLFGWAREMDFLEITPTAEMKAPKKPAPRDRYLSEDELKIFLQCVHAAGDYAAPITLLALTGQREEEMRELKRREIKGLLGAEPFIELPGKRTKNKVKHKVPLSNRAADILREIIKGENDDKDPRKGMEDYYVFSNSWTQPLSYNSKAKKRIDAAISARLKELKAQAEEAGDEALLERLNECFVKPWCQHSLRHTVKTLMAEKLKILPFIADALQNHGGAKTEMQKTYNHYNYYEEICAAMNKWADYIERLLNPDMPSAKIIPLHGAAS